MATNNSINDGFPIDVAHGGTGATALTQHAVLLGEATGAVSTVGPLTNGQLVIGSTGVDPVAASLGAGTGITVTAGAGTLSIGVNAGLTTLTGWASWGGAGAYFDDTTLGSFTLLRPGTGYIKGVLVPWAAPQTLVGLTAGTTTFVYIKSDGTIGGATSFSEAMFEDNIVLFECLRDSTPITNNQITVREDHPFQFPAYASVYLHESIGPIIENYLNGANITLNGTQKIQINGEDYLLDHGLQTTIPDSAGAAVTFRKMYTTAAGKWATYTNTDTFSGHYNNAGTPTVLTAGRFAVYTLYCSKDSLNVATPFYYAVLDTSQYTSLTSANTAISNGTTAQSSNELTALEVCRLGFIIFSQTTNRIVQVTISKSTLKQTFSTGGTNTASLVNTVTTSFNGILSAADTNVQQALDTIDDWGASATNHAVLIGRGVNTAIVGQLLTDGQLLIGKTGAFDPVATTLTAGTNISITNGAGSISIAASTGALVWAYANVNATPYVVGAAENFLSVDTSALAITINFPNAPTTGRIFHVKDRSGNANVLNITITTVGGAVLIDGAATYTMNTAFSAINLIFNGTSYEIF
jgi:hypothetical protein